MNANIEFVFIESQKKKRVLLFNGYRYNLNVTNKGGSTLWRCAKRNECSASVTINKDEDKVLRQLKEHSCKADFDKNKIDQVMDKCKKLVCEKAKPVQKIFEKEFEKMDEIKQVPHFSSKKDTLFRARRNFLKVPKTAFLNFDEIVIPNIFADKFLVCDDGYENNKILLFSTPTSIKCMSTMKNRLYFIDATFKAVPKPFYELLSIHIDLNSCDETTSVMGIVYALLPDKKQTTYERLFHLIKRHCQIEMTTIKCDYELALINAIKNEFPHSKIAGCYYHFNKAIWKKASALSLNENRESREVVRLCSNFPLLPSEYMTECWNAITQRAVETNKDVMTFLAYFEKQWLLSLSHIISCSYIDNFRTNNALEGWHRRLNTFIKPKPTLLLFLHALRKEARWQDRKFKNIMFEGNKRRKIDMLFNEKYKRELKKLTEKKICPMHFLINIGHIKRILNS